MRIADAIKRINEFARKDAVFASVSGSCNLMRTDRCQLHDENHVEFAYGCGVPGARITSEY